MKRASHHPRRTPLRRIGRIGRENEAFSQRMLAQWYADGMDAGRGVGERLVKVMAFDVRRVLVETAIEKQERPGLPHYVGHGVLVGHKPGYSKAQEPKHRWDPEAVEPQTPIYNAHLAWRGGGRKGE